MARLYGEIDRLQYRFLATRLFMIVKGVPERVVMDILG